MKISYNWLKDYIGIEMPAEELGKILTSIGLEVEGIHLFESVPGGLKGIVTGHVLTCAKHPNADKLSVTTVDVGDGTPKQIVCGAPNVAAGQKVLVATLGTTLYKNGESWEIKKAKIRGEESEGMICAEDELGLGESHAGIMVLPEETPVGMKASDYFSVQEDHVFEIGLTPNRIDAASHYGVARDLAAYFQHRKPVVLDRPSVDDWIEGTVEGPVRVTVENSEGCPRYSGLSFTGIKVAESPSWLQNRLRAIGMKPINNVVDVTNYVMHETGQPLHAFDAAQVKGKHVVIKNLPAGSPFVTLDGVERSLAQDDLMICNESEGMCIAGVFGGLNSGVSDSTTEIFLESAYFNPVHVRRTSKRHALNTDSSFRFERGADPQITTYALKRAAALLKEVSGAVVAGKMIDVYPYPVKEKTIMLTFSKVDALIGKHIERELIKDILRSLEIKIAAEKDKGLLLDIPTYRVDVEREVDVIEDILRIYGYNNVETSEKVNSNISYTAYPDKERVVNICSEYLASQGFYEIMTNSLTRTKYYEANAAWPLENCVHVINPLSNDLAVMRQSLLFGGLESLAHNINRKNSNLRLFEFGNIYKLNQNKTEDVLPGFHEEMHLSILISGDRFPENWNSPSVPTDFFLLKSYVENVFRRFGIQPEKLDKASWCENVMSGGMMYKKGDTPLVCLGEVKKELLQLTDCRQPVFYAEMRWNEIMKLIEGTRVRFAELPKYPEVRRDLALLLDQNVIWDDILRVAVKSEPELIQRVSLFDVYQGDKIEAGKKSYAVSYIIRDSNATLTDEKVEKVMQKLIRNYEQELGAQIRK